MAKTNKAISETWQNAFQPSTSFAYTYINCCCFTFESCRVKFPKTCIILNTMNRSTWVFRRLNYIALSTFFCSDSWPYTKNRQRHSLLQVRICSKRVLLVFLSISRLIDSVLPVDYQRFPPLGVSDLNLSLIGEDERITGTLLAPR